MSARIQFRVTFERFNPPQDGHDTPCEPDETGFINEGSSLRDAIPDICHGSSNPKWCGYAQPDSTHGRARWLYFFDYNDMTAENLQTGIMESRTLHIPDGITDSSARRVARLFAVEIAP